MTNTAKFNAEFKALFTELKASTAGEQMDELVTEFCELFEGHSLLNNFTFNVGNSYYDGVGHDGEISLELSNLLTNSYGIDVCIKISARENDPLVRAYPRIVKFIDKMGYGSNNYRYLDEHDAETIVLNDIEDDLTSEFVQPLCVEATDMLVKFVAELLGEPLAKSIRPNLVKEIAPNLVLED